MSVNRFSQTSLPPTLGVSGSACAPVWLAEQTSDEPDVQFKVTDSEPIEAKLLAQIEALGKLANDWDSYGGAAPSAAVIEAAWRFIAELYERARESGIEIGEPKLQAGGDGTVGFVWADSNADSTVEVVAHENGLALVCSQHGEISEDVVVSADQVLLLLAR